MKIKNKNFNAIILTALFSLMLLTPAFSALSSQKEEKFNNFFDQGYSYDSFDITKTIDNNRFVPDEDVAFAGEQNDIGYNIDAGNRIQRAIPIYASEPSDEKPGRGRTGSLEPNGGDSEDWYRYSVCSGQNIQVSINSNQNYDIEICDINGNPVGTSFTADTTGWHFIRVYADDSDGDGSYTIGITISGQNDADTGSDAGNNINQATAINPGTYYGFLDYNDHEDWYNINVDSGEGIFINVNPMEKSDYDIHLYNPDGEKVHSQQFYGEDNLEYPADMSGSWKIQIDIFPGWDASKWPDDYFLYGSGVYELEISVGGNAEAPPSLKTQPQIIPIAQTFMLNDDPFSNKDEYSYLAAVPAANYKENGRKYVSPIVYQGVDKIPNWFTSIDQTTQYLLDDWNTYLDRHDIIPDVFEIPQNPIQAASDIALNKWSSSDTAVLTIDGSDFIDEIDIILEDEVSLNCEKEISTYQPTDLKEIVPDSFSAPMYIGSQWGAIHVIGEGEDFNGDTMVLTPRYESTMADWWPHGPDYVPGQDKDTFYPIFKQGLWFPQVTGIDGLDELKVVKYSGDRYNLQVDDSSSSLKVEITTTQSSKLIIFLIDPDGNIRRPRMPHWNGGEIKPLHQWHGGHWEHDYDEYSRWTFEPHDDFSVEVHNPMEGTWTAIIVPFLDKNTNEAVFDGTYNIKATLRKFNPDRISAGLSATNAAVLASLKHVPLLYVTPNSVPSETNNVIESLGISNKIFVNLNSVSSADPGATTEYNTMQEIVNAIKEHSESENYITITSFATGDGYFAPSAMIAAFHGGPVLDIGEKKDAYNALDKYQSWREYDGDYYHGCRSLGALPMMNEPINIENPPSILDLIIYFMTNQQTLPPVGLDYKLQLATTAHNDIYDMINGYGLDKSGQEIYAFVSPRDTDIRDPIGRIMNGNNSYAGLIPVETTAFSSAMICRNILYPAIIYANPGRDVASSQHMNYFTAQYAHSANDGNSYYTDATNHNKNSFSSHGRFYEGHCIWDNLLERYNKGTSINYYSGHGTGGSGISSMYKNMAEQFPSATPTHESLYDFVWWDSWAGYSGYDDAQTKSIRDRAMSIYNAEEPSLYDFIHFKWVDQLFENLHSEVDIWSSCTTASHFGPIVYLSHGSVIYGGCTGSGYVLVDDLYKSFILRDFLIKGYTIGEAFSLNNWIVNRDYTTMDLNTIYGEGTFFADGIHSVNVVLGDPALQIYNPTWVEPIPIES
jgi:hypothetical protein